MRWAEADPDPETEELAVDVGTVVALARAFLPGMLARGSGGILNVASTIAFQPAPLQAVYGANKAFVLSFSQALWAEARPAGVAVTALCPGPTRTGFVDALGADVGHTAIYRRLADPGPVIKAGLGALDQGRAVVIPGLRNKVIATGGRFLPREWLTRFSGRLLRPASTAPRPPIDVHNQIVAPAAAERVWDLLADVEGWPSWYRACRWVRVEASPAASGGRHTRSRCAAPWWPVTGRVPSPSSRTPAGCTPSTRSRSAPRPTARAPSSSATKPRPGRSRGWGGSSCARCCTRPPRRGWPIWPGPSQRARSRGSGRPLVMHTASEPDTIAGWRAVADGFLSDPCCAFHRNVEISSCYAWLHQRQPACFKWAAMAAIASHHIRLVLFPSGWTPTAPASWTSRTAWVAGNCC